MAKEIVYIEASINTGSIFIKSPIDITPRLVDAFLDREYVLKKSTPDIWDLNISYGDSYEINSSKEVEEFIGNNIKYLKIAKND